MAVCCSSNPTPSFEFPYAAGLPPPKKRKKKARMWHSGVRTWLQLLLSLWRLGFDPLPGTVGQRIWHCHSCGIGHSCSSDSVPGTSIYAAGMAIEGKNEANNITQSCSKVSQSSEFLKMWVKQYLDVIGRSHVFTQSYIYTVEMICVYILF